MTQFAPAQKEPRFKCVGTATWPKNGSMGIMPCCGDSRIWCGYHLVTTRDVLSIALVTSDSFPAKSTSVFVLGQHSVNCASFV